MTQLTNMSILMLTLTRLTSQNQTSTLLRIQDRAKCGKGTELHGGEPTKNCTGRGDTAYTFLMSGTNGVGTPHNIERKLILGGGDTAHTLLGWGHRTTFTEKA